MTPYRLCGTFNSFATVLCRLYRLLTMGGMQVIHYAKKLKFGYAYIRSI